MLQQHLVGFDRLGTAALLLLLQTAAPGEQANALAVRGGFGDVRDLVETGDAEDFVEVLLQALLAVEIDQVVHVVVLDRHFLVQLNCSFTGLAVDSDGHLLAVLLDVLLQLVQPLGHTVVLFLLLKALFSLLEIQCIVMVASRRVPVNLQVLVLFQ